MCVGARGNHNHGYVTDFANFATQLEAVYARQHDVDENDIGRCSLEYLNGVFATGCFVNCPTLVFKGQLD